MLWNKRIEKTPWAYRFLKRVKADEGLRKIRGAWPNNGTQKGARGGVFDPSFLEEDELPVKSLVVMKRIMVVTRIACRGYRWAWGMRVSLSRSRRDSRRSILR
jgi:hypothetical protein